MLGIQQATKMHQKKPEFHSYGPDMDLEQRQTQTDHQYDIGAENVCRALYLMTKCSVFTTVRDRANSPRMINILSGTDPAGASTSARILDIYHTLDIKFPQKELPAYAGSFSVVFNVIKEYKRHDL